MCRCMYIYIYTPDSGDPILRRIRLFLGGMYMNPCFWKAADAQQMPMCTYS